jgi:hypothetical protein
VCPRIGGRRDRPNSPRTLLLQLSGLEDILSSVLDRREDRAGRPATHGRAQSTSQAGHDMNSLLSYPDLYSSLGARFVHPRSELPVAGCERDRVPSGALAVRFHIRGRVLAGIKPGGMSARTQTRA